MRSFEETTCKYMYSLILHFLIAGIVYIPFWCIDYTTNSHCIQTVWKWPANDKGSLWIGQPYTSKHINPHYISNLFVTIWQICCSTTCLRHYAKQSYIFFSHKVRDCQLPPTSPVWLRSIGPHRRVGSKAQRPLAPRGYEYGNTKHTAGW